MKSVEEILWSSHFPLKVSFEINDISQHKINCQTLFIFLFQILKRPNSFSLAPLLLGFSIHHVHKWPPCSFWFGCIFKEIHIIILPSTIKYVIPESFSIFGLTAAKLWLI